MEQTTGRVGGIEAPPITALNILPKSDTPRKAGGLMSRAPSNGVGSLAKASRRARLVQGSELPGCSIRFLLLADGAADFFQFKPDRGNGVPASPQVLAGEIPLPAIESGHRDGALPLQKPDHRSHRVLGGNSNADMHMVGHQMPFQNLAFLLSGQRVKNFAQLPTHLSEQYLTPSLGHEHHMVFAIPP